MEGYSDFLDFPGSSAGKESVCKVGDLGLISGLGRSPGEGNSYPLQYSGLKNSMGCIVHRVTKSHLSNFHFSDFLSLKKVWIILSFQESIYFRLSDFWHTPVHFISLECHFGKVGNGLPKTNFWSSEKFIKLLIFAKRHLFSSLNVSTSYLPSISFFFTINFKISFHLFDFSFIFILGSYYWKLCYWSVIFLLCNIGIYSYKFPSVYTSILSRIFGIFLLYFHS